MFLSLLYHLFLYWTKYTVRNCFYYVKYYINFFLLVTEYTLQIPTVRFHIAKNYVIKAVTHFNLFHKKICPNKTKSRTCQISTKENA